MRRAVSDHRNQVLELVRGAWQRRLAGAGAVQTVSLAGAVQRVLASDIAAPVSLPPFANSQMDGYAVISGATGSAGATGSTVEFDVAPPVPAGRAAGQLPPGCAVPVMTGAMLPAGADAVVPVEQAVPDSFAPFEPGRRVALPANVPAGQFVRAAGSDIEAGALALPAGTVLKAAQLGLLAALGIAEVPVLPRLRVLLLSTGDEVVAPGGTLGPGQIYDANTTLLSAALAEAGCEVVSGRILADAPEPFARALAADLDRFVPDLVLSTGGISKGAFEVVKQALAGDGTVRAAVDFVSVAMQPGGPQGIGSVLGTAFLGFPGNPVSCLVSFEMFLRPVLSTVLAVPAPRTVLNVPLRLPAGGTLDSPAGIHQVRRGWYNGAAVLPMGGPGSHLVHALARSNALIQLPEDLIRREAGQNVEIWLL
ncbi:molybdopterin molybdotransferase MoeA [Arthrobacter sp. I2-34]|uniref:Molybdopterin molybdenumtransferase n=1 Tax=Arthrobacter hankyongi TaxID=2904801 RepID=A0ABS9L155_9MICC|nr:gephyrin-like molybdotransferase Glp [Arthrobacter hankyongi]MCG2620364.1 molybdopterin molybdotransferase MoeA [Arthrobacter hankyongi]